MRYLKAVSIHSQRTIEQAAMIALRDCMDGESVLIVTDEPTRI
ncbi:hypothetical protein QUF80_19165 [Desulfococcaceae bacterium HSG8]|nr:hypothetical protein [Desulfococcaceae bacterium HSG8]